MKGQDVINNYIPASPCSYLSQLSKSRMTVENFNKILKLESSGVLHCINENISSGKTISKLSNKLNKTLDKLSVLAKDLPIYLDSGGFQILTGKYNLYEVIKLMEHYYEFLLTTNRYDKAFVLDLPPNDMCFSNWGEVEYWNSKSYSECANLNSEKTIFVFHMLNYESYSIFNNLFDKHVNDFKMFAVGGIAIKQYGNLNRIISYSVPFRVYLEKCLQHKIKSLPLHFLGAGQNSSTLTFLFELCREFIIQTYGVFLEIQSDSSPHARLAQGRKYQTIVSDTLYTFDYFTNSLTDYFQRKTKGQYILNELNKYSEDYGLGVTLDSIYQDNKKGDMTFYNTLCLHDLYIYNRIRYYIREQVPNLIKMYYDDREKFLYACIDILVRLNGGRLTRNLKEDCTSILKFMEIMQDKDLNRVEFLLKQNSSALFTKNDLMEI